MPIEQSRRRFLTKLSVAALSGVGGFAGARLGSGARSFAAEPPPEVTTITLEKTPTTCLAPQYVAGELLRAEGFTDIRYQAIDEAPALAVAHDQLDWELDFAPEIILAADAGAALTAVAGIHVGCYELIAHDHIRSIAGLKGRTVGWSPGYSSSKDLVALMTKLVGLDPDKDIHWVSDPKIDPMALFIDRKIDAFLAAPPQPQELRARGIGHSLLNSATDRPWSQYFCCLLFSRTEFVQKYPVATKRIVRALLKATDLCANEPARAARLMVDQGFTPRYDFALQTLQELPYAAWRDHDPEDTMRFFALRMNEAGFTKSNPQRIIARHTNWRFLNEVKRELKV
jgi:NitT/TauT family transport system substrate-binding protein